MANTELMQQLEEEFKLMKKELGFKATLNQLDGIFFIRDYIHINKFVSTHLSRAICHRLVDTVSSWSMFYHGIIMPNPHSMFNVTEAKMFNDDEKKEMMSIMNQIAELRSRNSLIGITKDNEAEGKFIDDCLKFWKKTLNPNLLKTMEKINQEWQKQSEDSAKQQKK